MALATLDRVKLKAGVPLSNASFDVAIQHALDAADRYVKNLTGWEETASEITEYVTGYQTGRFLTLKKRPIDTLGVIQGKRPGGTDWTAFEAVVIDPIAGQILPSISGSVTPGAVRESTLGLMQVLEVSYTTLGGDPPEDLADAVAALAAYWHRRDRAHAVESQTVASVTTRMLQVGVPKWIEARLDIYIRPIGGLV